MAIINPLDEIEASLKKTGEALEWTREIAARDSERLREYCYRAERAEELKKGAEAQAVAFMPQREELRAALERILAEARNNAGRSECIDVIERIAAEALKR